MQMPSPTAWPIFLIQLSYGVPSVLLYLLTFSIIIRHRKVFDSSFFQLYVYDGFMNLFTYLVGLFKTRFTSITCYECLLGPFYRNIGNFISLNFVMAMNYHLAYIQYSLTTLISLNRLSVLLKFKVCEPIWKKYTWLLIAVVYFAPFINTHCVFKYNAIISYSNETDSYSLVSPQLPLPDIFSVLIPFMIVTILLSVASNLTSLIIVRNMNIQNRSNVETNFLIIMSITCAVQLIGTIISLGTVNLAGTPIAKTLALILPFVSDGLTLVQPWLLICFSQMMRKKLKLAPSSRVRTQTSQLVLARSTTN